MSKVEGGRVRLSPLKASCNYFFFEASMVNALNVYIDSFLINYWMLEQKLLKLPVFVFKTIRYKFRYFSKSNAFPRWID